MTSWRTLIPYLVLSRNCEESSNKLFMSADPHYDPDHLRGGLSHSYIPSCVNKKKKNILFKVEQNGKYNTSEFAITM